MSKTTRDHLTLVDETAGPPVYCDGSTGTYHVWCTPSDYEPVSTALVMGVASVLGVHPEDLESLTGHVDPDAINRIVGHWNETSVQPPERSVTFPFANCQITVYADGEIVIDPPQHIETVYSSY